MQIVLRRLRSRTPTQVLGDFDRRNLAAQDSSAYSSAARPSPALLEGIFSIATVLAVQIVLRRLRSRTPTQVLGDFDRRNLAAQDSSAYSSAARASPALLEGIFSIATVLAVQIVLRRLRSRTSTQVLGDFDRRNLAPVICFKVVVSFRAVEIVKIFVDLSLFETI